MERSARFQRRWIKRNGITRVVPKAHKITVQTKDIGVRGVFDAKLRDTVVKGPHNAGRDRLTSRRLIYKRRRFYPTVYVPCTVVAEMERMHHTVAVEGVIAILRLKHRVGTVAVISAAQIGRQLTNNLELVLIELTRRRRIHTVKIGIVVVVNPCGRILKLRRCAQALITNGELSERRSAGFW